MKLTERGKIRLVVALLVGQYLWQFFNRHLAGLLILSVLLYAGRAFFSESPPYTLDQLVIWVSELDSTTKTEVLTGLVTILGFLIAFHSGYALWKRQTALQMRGAAVGEIQDFFTRAARLLTDAAIHTRFFIQASEALEQNPTSPNAAFLAREVQKRLSGFMQTRDQLVAMTIDVHKFTGKYITHLAHVWAIPQRLDAVTERFSQVVRLLWYPLPHLPNPDEDPAPRLHAQFTAVTNGQARGAIFRTHWQQYLVAYDQNFKFINTTVGMMHGQVHGEFSDQTLAGLFWLLRRRKQFVGIFDAHVASAKDRSELH